MKIGLPVGLRAGTPVLAAALVGAVVAASSGIALAGQVPARQLAAVTLTAPTTTVPQARAVDVYATYYGWYDNTPPGCATAYSGCAGGTGTFAHPITLASDKAEFPVGTILYYPTVEKYFVMGDDCQECDEDWSGSGPDGGPHLYHVDLWIGGQGGNEFDVINCEDALTQGMPNGSPLLTPFIVNPPSNMSVSTEPLFNVKTQACYGGATTSNSYGRYENVATRHCLADLDDASASGTAAVLSNCATRPAQDLTFDGAFFFVNKLCLQSEGFKTDAAIEFTTCTGGPAQQWEVNPNSTISGIQYGGCLGEINSRPRLVACSSSTADHWKFTTEPAP